MLHLRVPASGVPTRTSLGRAGPTAYRGQPRWGLAIVWEDGRRTWYPRDLWCLDLQGTRSLGFEIEIADDTRYVRWAHQPCPLAR